MTNPLTEDKPRRGRWSLVAALRNSFLTGLVVIAPIGLTVWLIWTVVGWVDSFVWPFVPDAYQPNALLNRWMIDDRGRPHYEWLFEALDRNADGMIEINVRGLGVVIFLIFTVIVGWIAKGFLGRSFISWAEGLVDRTPVVRSIYNGVKQIAETVFAQQEANFEKACLIQYPREGIWAIGFISAPTRGEVLDKADPDEMLSVFVPTTPNPTSGFLLFFPKKDVKPLDMSIEDAAKLVISAGLVYPEGKTPMPPAFEVEDDKIVRHDGAEVIEETDLPRDMSKSA